MYGTERSNDRNTTLNCTFFIREVVAEPVAICVHFLSKGVDEYTHFQSAYQQVTGFNNPLSLLPSLLSLLVSLLFTLQINICLTTENIKKMFNKPPKTLDQGTLQGISLSNRKRERYFEGWEREKDKRKDCNP